MLSLMLHLARTAWQRAPRKFVSSLTTAAQVIEIPNPTVSPSPLVDSFGRNHTYLRISLTERCNLRCRYCMPAEGVELAPNEQMLSPEELQRLAGLFVRNGVNKIRLTGGEPLVRKDIVAITRRLNELDGLKSLAMTTNGITLKRKLPALKEAGLTALNISLDTLEAAKFELITRRKGLEKVLDSIYFALDLGFRPLKVNMVIMKGINDDELPALCQLTEKNDIDVRLIEYMPFDGNRWSDAKFVSYASMLEVIAREYGVLERAADGPHDTCKHYRIPGYVGRVGFITSMTDHFCGSCNRLRLTADGNLKVCLFGKEEVSLRDVMRRGAGDEELERTIAVAVRKKNFKLGGNADMYDISKAENRSMIRIGGRLPVHHSLWEPSTTQTATPLGTVFNW